ncbi:MAG: oligosaccharide flippase family protein [Rubrobacteraceae bacterium]|nr:oligosaccharide flippase family protein [Rubrobacteraceae bacterium]
MNAQAAAAPATGADLLRRRLLSGGAWALGGRIGLAVIGFLNNALLARVLTPSQLGAYFLAFTILGLCVSFGSLGLTKSIVRFVAESVGLGQYERARRAVKLSLLYGTLGALAVGVLYVLFGGKLAERLFDSPALAAVAGVTAGWILVATVQGILVEAFRGLHDIRMTILLGGFASGQGFLTGGLIVLSLAALWVLRGHAGLATVMLLAAGSGAVSALLAGLLLRGRMSGFPRGDSKTTIRGSEMMRISWPLMATNVALFALTQSSYWIAGAFLNNQDVALYGAAYRLMTYVEAPLAIAGTVTPPLIAEMYAQGRLRELESTLRSVATVAFIPSFFALLLFVFLGGPIMGLAFGHFYEKAALALAILSLGQIVNVWTGSCQQVLMMAGQQDTMMAITLVTGGLIVAAATFGAQRYGVPGISIAVAAGFALQNILMMLAAKRKTGVWTHVVLPMHYLT